MKWWFSIGIVLMAVMVGCGDGLPRPAVTPSQRGTAYRTLEEIDSLMWHHPDSALAVLLDYLDDDGRDAARHVSTNETFDNHYAQLLASELLFKNDCAQTNRTELLQAVAYFDSLMLVADGADARGKSDTRGASIRPDPRRDASNASAKTLAFLDARAHYINGAGYYEQGDLVNACTEYLNTLRIMESHFAENELVGHKARFMAYTYNRLGDLFSEQFMQEPAIYCYKQALVYNRIAPTSPYGNSKIFVRIGKQYDKLKMPDSAFYYHNKTLELLPDRNNMVYRDIVASLALSEFAYHGDAITALDSLKNIVTQASNEAERINRYMTIGSIYYILNQYDSAKVYLEPVWEKDPDKPIIAAKHLKDIALKEGDTLKANEYSIILANEGASAAENQAQVSKLNDMFQSYLQEKQEAASLRERRKAVRLTLMVLVPLLVAIGLAVAIVMWRRHRKRLAAQEADAQRRLEEERQSHRMEQAALSGRLKRSNETLRELQGQVRQQNETTPKPETQAASFAEEPICQLIMQRVNEGQFKSQMDCTVYKDYALGKEQMTALREAADRHFNQFTSRLAKAYPDLTRNDLDYCCLYLLGLSDADVAALMQKAYSTVSDRSRKLKNIFGNEKPLPISMLDFANGKTLV